MRNPTSFSGIRDFAKVVAAARRQGCLMARKFVVKDGQTISVDEWKDTLYKAATTDQEKKDQ